ncbi:hypothetical protein L1987_65200 [Smallanthus sonchifolius]|uniref:Uncharacterized protein n=1 Tax=Smallanthus sonchifolius TaxID=185202 RepID=A0ACB9BTV6_9ASTR|nr:hypothetical protein L1987_65200 [Smallanthus sonchifolius]
MEETQEERTTKEAGMLWDLFTNGVVCIEGSGVGLLLISPEGTEFTRALKFSFQTSNNETEYEGLLAGLRWAVEKGARNVRAHVDSLLVANQINEIYEAKGPTMARYLNTCKSLLRQFVSWEVIHIPRSQNNKADALSKIASNFSDPMKAIHLEIIQIPSTEMVEVNTTQQEESWITPIKEYLEKGTLPPERSKAHKLQAKATQYQLHEGTLYRRSFLCPLLRCVDRAEANYLIREIHFGICGIHAGPRVRPQTREASLIGFTHSQAVLKHEYQITQRKFSFKHNLIVIHTCGSVNIV